MMRESSRELLELSQPKIQLIMSGSREREREGEGERESKFTDNV